MIECKDILALCDRFESYLMPLDLLILRQRYAGHILKSTDTMPPRMGLSHATVPL